SGRLSLTNLKRNSFVGTPYWMAPELIKRSGYSFKVDIWSLGITVYEVAKGVPPFMEYEPMKAIMMIPKSAPPQLPSEFSKHIRDFLSHCLDHDPEKRLSAEELLKHKFIKSAKKNDLLMDLVIRHQEWEAKNIKDDKKPDLL
ncbi:kinase-like protein, partial [Rozella allomycis CSF55]